MSMLRCITKDYLILEVVHQCGKLYPHTNDVEFEQTQRLANQSQVKVLVQICLAAKPAVLGSGR